MRRGRRLNRIMEVMANSAGSSHGGRPGNFSHTLALAVAVMISGCASGRTVRGLAPTRSTQVQPSALEEPVTGRLPGELRTRASDGTVMVYVPAGEFVMGSDAEEVEFALQTCRAYGTNCSRAYFSVEQPKHRVTLDAFWLDRTEVTLAQYSQCVDAGACSVLTCEGMPYQGEADFPAACVTWEQAVDYCEWAGARLPTEAEWEYAARGPDGLRYPWGDVFDGTLSNYCDVNCTLGKRDVVADDGYAQTAPVGSYPAGASWVGALDLAGNVWEMVADWFQAYPADAQMNPIGPGAGLRRVVRGGSWHASPDHIRSTLRSHVSPKTAIDHVGFRCALSDP